MSDHFIREIEIKNYKLFHDFKAEGFGRVNLIGGKNNVGKTALMEACYLGTSMLNEQYTNFFGEDYFDDNIERVLSEKVAVLSFHRNHMDYLMHNKILFPYREDSEFIINNISYSYEAYLDFNKGLNDTSYNLTFISELDIFNEKLVNSIDELKLQNKEDSINQILHELFNIEKVDVIKDTVMFKQNGKFLPLSQFGDGMKHFLILLMTLHLNNDSIIYLDEIENGIHYSNFDKLWEIILTISKEQNVQVFATTHSKECIESYARVSKALDEKDITYTILTRLDDGSIDAGVYDAGMLLNAIEQDHEVRGW